MIILKNYLIAILIFTFANSLIAEEKKIITHDDYSSWKSISEYSISNNGELLLYEISPLEGDGYLYIKNLKTHKLDSIPRAYKAKFSSNSNFVVFKIKPQTDTVRAAKLKKVKKDKLPKDSIGIFIPETNSLLKYPDVVSFKLGKDGGNFVALLLENKKEQTKDKDTVSDTTKQVKKKGKQKKSNSLLLINPINENSFTYNNVSKYSLSDNGKSCIYTVAKTDSIDSVFVYIHYVESGRNDLIYNSNGYSENVSTDKEGKQFAFTFSSDTVKNKAYSLYYYSQTKLNLVSGDEFSNLSENMTVSTNGSIYFNDRGTELFFGETPKPLTEIKDTLTEDEKVSIDIWNWKDDYLQPMQKLRAEKEKKRSYTSVYFPLDKKVVSLGNKNLEDVFIKTKENGNLVLGRDNHNYRKEISWDGSRHYDYYLIDKNTGDRKLILKKVASTVSLSPQQNFVAWYNIADSSWNAYDIKKEKSNELTSYLKENFYYELNDIPNEAPNYGFAGWTDEEKFVVYDKYDFWLISPDGTSKAKNITNYYGRKNDIQLRYKKLNPDLITLPENMMLTVFDLKTKNSGYASFRKLKDLKILIIDNFDFFGMKKAKNNDKIVWRKQSFIEYPELYVSDMKFRKVEKITNTNPQQKDYNWGTVELVDFTTLENDSMQGMLYKPENFDPNKKYPMIVYFYERYTDRLNRYYSPKPIRSVINFTYYTSNGYLIFIPDIKYETGYPGPSGFNCIVGGTKSLIEKYDYIDQENIAIQGQSWGGYQVAYIVTQTNMYKAAMAGAPVSNMTSAYGGIRWSSGMSRTFQYEETQSRIGATLWERQDLYILNSPLFFAPQVETPLLMMHNDKDGAVPWYQGIEFFSALRRLNKPVWMLVYNGAPHNLKRLADEKDLTIRMQQFFDHFLKGKPEPMWMKKGVPAVEKGREFGFELSE